MSAQMIRSRARRAEEGAATVEYIGMVVAASVLLVSMLMLVTPIGSGITDTICRAIASIGGSGVCEGSGTDVSEKAPPKGPYVTQSDELKIDAGISISFVDLGGGIGMAVEELSDGTYRVTLVDKAKLGASLTAGEVKGKLKIGEYGGSLEASAALSASLEGAYAVERTFNSPEEVLEFQVWATRQYGEDALKQALGPVVGMSVPVISWMFDKMMGYDYKPPDPSAIYFEAGGSATGKASIGGIIAGAGAEASFANALGTRLDADGSATVYTRITLDGKVESDYHLQKLADGSIGLETVLFVTVDPNGNVTEVGFSAAATAEGSYNLTQLTGTPDLDSGNAAAAITASFPVTDANRAETVDMLIKLGVVQGALGTTASQATAVPWIVDQAMANDAGDVWAQTYDVSTDNLVSAALSLKAPEVGGIGLELEASTSSRTTTSTRYLGRNGWVDW
ncbi:MAG: hypothetical protein FWD11_02370 [Micrococcales bacterium]|nr:hypothetical protein [Micrococcales bacterium]